MSRRSRSTTAHRLAAAALGLLTAGPGLLLLDAGAAGAAAHDGVTNGLIAFSDDRDGNREIYTIRPDGTGLERLTDDPADDTMPQWSPDGQRIVFMRGASIYTMDADGTDQTKVVGYAWPGEPTWSPDGTRLAFTREDSVYVVDADGTDELKVAQGVQSYGNESPDWHPDGSRIIYRSNKGPGSLVLETVRPDGTDPQSLGRTGSDPVWSPDGEWLAFEELGLSTLDPEGNEERVVFLNGEGEGTLEGLAWAPDQSGFVYAQRRWTGTAWTHPDVRTVAADGSGVTTVTPGWQPDWQPVLPDPVAPETTITTSAPRWSLDQPAVGFTADANGATFECRVDAGAWQGCAAPYVPAWKAGSHVLRVRASSGGLTDTTPAQLRWTAPYDDRQLTGRRWRSATGPAYYRSTARVATVRGATLSRAAVRASEIGLVATTCPGCGKVDVYYGKQRLRRVSLASSSTRHRVLIPVRRWSSAQQAQPVRVVVVTKGKRVVVDGLALR